MYIETDPGLAKESSHLNLIFAVKGSYTEKQEPEFPCIVFKHRCIYSRGIYVYVFVYIFTRRYIFPFLAGLRELAAMQLEEFLLEVFPGCLACRRALSRCATAPGQYLTLLELQPQVF